MVRKAGKVQLRIDASCVQAMTDSNGDQESSKETLSNVLLSALTIKALTSLMKGIVPDMTRMRRGARRCIRQFLRLNFVQQQAVLNVNGVYIAGQFPDSNGNEGAPDNVADQIPVEDQAEEDGVIRVSLDSENETSDDSSHNLDDDLPLSSDSDADVPEDADLVPWPSEKRRRVMGKQRTEVHLTGGDEVFGVIPRPCGTSRVSRELGETVFVVDWGTRNPKPTVLTVWGEQYKPGLPMRLTAIAGKEDGHVYYATVSIDHSASALWLLTHCGQNDAYSRMQLLFSPSESCFPFDDSDYLVEYVEPILNSLGIDPTDGMAEMSFDLAFRMGVVSTRQRHDYSSGRDGETEVSATVVYSAFQFRGFLFFPKLNQTGLVKGMMRINESLKGLMLKMPASTVKVLAPGISTMTYGLDITKTTSKVLRRPRLSPAVVAVVRLRIAMVSDVRRRRTLMSKLETMVAEVKKFTATNLALEAYGLKVSGDAPDELPHQQLASIKVREERQLPRISVQDIDVLVTDDPESLATDLGQLDSKIQETDPHCLKLGTKEALMRGNNRALGSYYSLRRKPYGSIPSFGATLYALGDVTGRLADKQCWLIVAGKCVQGTVVVWRNPCQLPWDMELWEALEYPDQERTVPDNSIILSTKGHANSRMAGGDQDGDQNMLSFHQGLIDLVKATSAAGELQRGGAERRGGCASEQATEDCFH